MADIRFQPELTGLSSSLELSDSLILDIGTDKPRTAKIQL
jgi:hypothetical protein